MLKLTDFVIFTILISTKQMINSEIKYIIITNTEFHLYSTIPVYVKVLNDLLTDFIMIFRLCLMASAIY